MALRAQSTTKDYIRAEHKLKAISKLFIPQVILPQVFLAQTTAQILFTILERITRSTIAHVLEPIHISRALSITNCIKQGDLFYSACLTQEKLGRGFENMQVNGPEG